MLGRPFGAHLATSGVPHPGVQRKMPYMRSPTGKGCLFTLDPFASFRARQDADDGFSQFNHYTAFRFGMTFR